MGATVVVTVVEFALFAFGFSLTIWFFSVVLLPVFYGVPKSLVWALRGWLLWRASALYLLAPVFWLFIFSGAAVVLAFFFPNASARLRESGGFGAGQALGLFFSVGRSLFSPSTRAEMRRDFLAVIAFNLTPVGIAALETLGIVPTTRAAGA